MLVFLLIGQALKVGHAVLTELPCAALTLSDFEI